MAPAFPVEAPLSPLPRLAPIARPRHWLVRLGFRLSRRRFGRVLTVLKVIYARQPSLLAVVAHVDWVREHRISIEPSLRLLVSAKTAMLNGCEFCHDITLAEAVARRIGRERFAALADAGTSEAFTERERTALLLVEEIAATRTLGDATFGRLRAVFSEREIVELVWLNAVETYLNLQARPLGIGSDGLAALAAAG